MLAFFIQLACAEQEQYRESTKRRRKSRWRRESKTRAYCHCSKLCIV